MRFEDLNWMQIQTYLEKDDRVILILGACEQHGYLSLLTDVRIPHALALSASDRTGVPVAPPLNFGCSPYFLDYPGTISLQLQTYVDLVSDVISSLYHSGFHRMLILNGHGGNTPVKTHLVEVVNQYKDLHLTWYAWWTTETVAGIAEKYNIEPHHANWLEAFDFTEVAELPSESKAIPNEGVEILGKARTKKIYGDGSFGGQYRVDSFIMQEIYDACLEDVLHLLKFEG